MPAGTPAWLRDALEDLARAQVRSEERFAAAHAETETQLSRLAAAQARTDQRFEEFAAAQKRTDERLDQLATAQQDTAAQVALLAAVQTRTNDRLDRVETALQQLTDRVGGLTGWVWEDRFRDHAPSVLSSIARNVRVLALAQLDNLLRGGVTAGWLSDDEAEEVRLADLVYRGRDVTSNVPLMIVVEVSARVATRDVDRAVTRAGFAAKLGDQAVAVVAGQRIDRDAEQRALDEGVRRVIITDA